MDSGYGVIFLVYLLNYLIISQNILEKKKQFVEGNVILYFCFQVRFIHLFYTWEIILKINDID